MTIVDLNRAFSTEDKCREYMKRLRWPHGVTCPKCSAKTVSTLKAYQKWECTKCAHQFTVTANTIFHDTHLPLEKWFLATYCMCESRKGVSANQLKRMLGVSYKTAWYLCHRIRAAMKDADTTPLEGTIEVDETYIGGKRRDRRARVMDNKTMVLGAIARGGEIRLKVDKRNSGPILRKFVRENTNPDEPKTIYTDDATGYRMLKGDKDTVHESVNHSEEEWVRGQVHTNSIEGVFSLFKRSIVGAYHQVSAKHLPAYLDEMEFRFNRRNNAQLFQDTVRHLVTADPLTFKKLVNRQ